LATTTKTPSPANTDIFLPVIFIKSPAVLLGWFSLTRTYTIFGSGQPQHHDSFITALASAHSLTFKKYLWHMIYLLADLEAEVVSNYVFVPLHYHVSNIPFLSDEFL
jgi:hypothetical protein